jgi:hypothetical protein
MELVIWSDKYVRDYNPDMNDYDRDNTNKLVEIERVQNDYKTFSQQVKHQN